MERRGKQGRQGLRCQLLHSLQRSIAVRLCLLCSFVLSVGGETPLFRFSQFFENDSAITAHGDARYSKENHSYVVNVDSVATSTGSCGMLRYGRNDVRIRNTAAGKVASFSTSFTFKFTTPPQPLVWDDLNSTASELGTYLAFVISHYDEIQQAWMLSSIARKGTCSITPALDRAWFGVNFKTDYNYNKGQVSNNFVGVADSRSWPVYQPGSTYNLCGNRTHCSYLTNGGSFTAWIDYTAERSIEVRLLNGSYPHEGKPDLEPLFVYPNFEIPPNLGEYTYLGLFGSSAVNHIEAHEVSSWTFSISNVEHEMAPRNHWVAPVFGVGGAIAALTVLGVLSLWLRKHRKGRGRGCAALKSPVFSYRELLRATKNFSENEIIGRGGFGTVYRASFGDTKLAVKRIHYEAKHAETTFQAEISSLGLIRHRNVVQLQGWFHEKDRLLLVYEYMPNGSLNEWLYKSGDRCEPRTILSWKLRHRILKEVATALEYLHTHCLQCVLHRDVKSSNVLLDANFKAHLADFGLARLMDHQKNDRTTMAAGTLGYMAPEMPYTGKATKESDVYSFGVLVLEVVCGKQPLDLKAPEPEDIVLIYTVWRAQEADTLLSVADPRLLRTSHEAQPSTSHDPRVCNHDNTLILNAADDDVEVEVEKLIKNLLHLGLLCCLPNPKVRPTMEQVVQILQQIHDTDNVDHVVKSMPPLPKTKPLGLYPSLESSQTPDFTILESLPVTSSQSARTRSSVDEVRTCQW